MSEPNPQTLVATEVFFFGAAVFLATPVGFAALVVVVAFLGPRFAPVLAVAFFLVTTGSGTVSKTLGRELPVGGSV